MCRDYLIGVKKPGQKKTSEASVNSSGSGREALLAYSASRTILSNVEGEWAVNKKKELV
jgi:hypothetical protein